jgi:hypothetical protein
MIQAEIFRDNNLIMARTYGDRQLTLQAAVERLQDYVLSEKINVDGQCEIKVRFLEP